MPLTPSLRLILGMMPLNLFMYSRRFQDDDSFPIPFMKIIMGLLTMIGPLTAGCILRHFKKAWALKLVKLLKPVSFSTAYVLSSVMVQITGVTGQKYPS